MACSDTACADRIIGIDAFRTILCGKRTPSQAESTAWRDCLPNLELDEIIHPLARIDCPDVTQMGKARHIYVPRCNQIECHTATLERISRPEFRAHDRFEVPRSEQNADSIWPFSLETLLDDLQATDWDEFDSSRDEG